MKWAKTLSASLLAGAVAAAWGEESLVRYRIEGDGIPAPLIAAPGDAARGKQVVTSRDSNCLLCHAVPASGERFMGSLGPPLAGVGTRLSRAQVRLRIVDSTRVNPDTGMPAYYRIKGLNRVAAQYRGKPLLTAQQVEDVVAYLATLE